MPYRRAELSHLLGHSGAQVFICATRPEGVDGVKHVVPLGERFGSLAASAPLQRVHKGSPDERFLLLYTSGTTDNPKGVPHAQRGFLANAEASVPELKFQRGNHAVRGAAHPPLRAVRVPREPVLGRGDVALAGVHPGRAGPSNTEPHGELRVRRPAHFKPMLDAGLLERHDFSSVRFACLSGSPVPPELAAAVETKLQGREKPSSCGA